MQNYSFLTLHDDNLLSPDKKSNYLDFSIKKSINKSKNSSIHKSMHKSIHK